MASEKQEDIKGAGFEELKPPKIKAIEDAAEEVREIVSKRLKLQEKETEADDRLQKVLHKHEDKLTIRDKDGNPGYVYYVGDQAYIAKLKRSDEKVSVTQYKPPKPPKQDTE